MTPAEAIEAIRGYALANRILYSPHAKRRMSERGATYADVRCALETANSCVEQENHRWRTTGGEDLDGDELAVVVEFEAGLMVVTVF
jgi:hypothetical protein